MLTVGDRSTDTKREERSRDPASGDQGQIEATQILRSLRKTWTLTESVDKKSGWSFKAT